MKVCLISLRTTHQTNYESYWREHLGIGYLAAILKENGYDVNIIDGCLNQYTLAQVIERMGPLDYELIGISVYPNMVDTLRLIAYIKKRNPLIHITIGGHYATCSVDQLMTKRSGFDSVCMGEGEKTILNLANKIKARESWKDILGLAYWEHDGLIKNPMPDLVEDLDTLPYPMRDVQREVTALSISASRGCYGQCTFCDINSFYRRHKGQKVRVRSVGSIIDEIKGLVRDYGIKDINFVDDNFLGNIGERKQWARNIADELIKSNLNIRFIIECRVNDIDEKTVEKLKKAGLYRVFLGVESFLPHTLKLFNKMSTPEENLRAISILRKYDIGIAIGYFLYYPDAIIQDVAESLKRLFDIAYWEFACHEQTPASLLIPLRLIEGTPIYKYYSRKNMILSPGGNEKGQEQYLFTDKRVKIFKDFIAANWAPDIREKFNSMYSYFINDQRMGQGHQYKQNAKAALQEISRIDLEFLMEVVALFESDASSVQDIALRVLELYKNRVDHCYSSFTEMA